MSDEFILGTSHLPEALFPSKDALNGLMDTFPDVGLGTGLVTDDFNFYASSEEADESFAFTGMGDLSDVTSTDFNRKASLVDHSWMEIKEPQFVDMDPGQDIVPELEEMWGRDHKSPPRKKSLFNVDREHAVYTASLAEKPPTPSVDLTTHVRAARRRLSDGAPLRPTLERFARDAGADNPQVRTAAQAIISDAGLIGKVFIRAQDFPDCHRGTHKFASQGANLAPYVIGKKACGGCIHAQNGNCSVFKKKIVASVPWKEALNKFKPRLASAQINVPEVGDPKEILRSVLGSRAPTQKTRLFWDTHTAPSDRIDAQSAMNRLAAVSPPPAVTAMTASAVKNQIGRWVKAGVLPSHQADILIEDMVDPARTLSAAISAVRSVKTEKYSGIMNYGKVGSKVASHEDVLRFLAASEASAIRVGEEIKQAISTREYLKSREYKWVQAVHKKAGEIANSVKNGLRGARLVKTLEMLPKNERSLIAEIIDPVVSQHDALTEASTQGNSYSGIANNSLGRTMSASEAWNRIKSTSPEAQVIRRKFDAGLKRQKVASHLRSWVDYGIIRKDDVDVLLASGASPEDLMRAASQMVRLNKSGAYSGVENTFDLRYSGNEVPYDVAVATLKKASSRRAEIDFSIQKHISDKQVRLKVSKIITAIESGLRGTHLATFINQVIAGHNEQDVMSAVAPILTKTAALDISPQISKVYSGPVYKEAPAYKPSDSHNITKREVVGMLKWVQARMSSGLAGSKLTQSIKAKFVPRLITAGAKYITANRNKHEGLAGFLYVDPLPLASKVGTAGCEDAAKVYQKSTAKHVLAMSRCASCTKKSTLPSGEEKCMVLNRVLASKVPSSDPVAYKRKILASVDRVPEVAAVNEYGGQDFDLTAPGQMVLDSGTEPEMHTEDFMLGGMLGGILL